MLREFGPYKVAHEYGANIYFPAGVAEHAERHLRVVGAGPIIKWESLKHWNVVTTNEMYTSVQAVTENTHRFKKDRLHLEVLQKFEVTFLK